METQNTKNKIICRFCKSENTIKWTTRKTENRGLIQRYKCKDCNKTFTLDDGFFRMRNSPQKITQAVDLFYRGASTRGTQEHLGMFFPHNADHSTILRWVWKYAKVISKFTDKLRLNISEEIQFDEIEYHRRKSHKSKGTEENFFIDGVCPTTRFMIASEYSKCRSKKKITAIISSAKERTTNKIQMVTTDGLNAYIGAVKKVFGYSLKEGKQSVFHNRVVTSKQEDVFNYPIERLHNNVRARTKVFRGFHGSLRSANLILKGYEIYYNFIRINQAINKRPYELATDLKLKENNKWLELIKMSSQLY
ncbi:MAG: hypothetical protein NTX24_04820 [Candidatus Pacearchaeota archaeon]|nr:hypothetical protein [Candidatus Pacearchaeota archaeon]